mgnify:FL=1|jgi:prepilin-type N-terminal cleavage/methylation domain-containing protein
MQNKAFTLIELLVALAILAVMSAVGYPIYQDYIKDSKIQADEMQTTFNLIEGLANDDINSSSGLQLPAGVKLCADAGCNGPYSVYSSDPCQNPYEGGYNKQLAGYFMKLRCQAKPNNVSCNNPHAVRKSWKGRVLKYGDRGPMQCK